MVADFGHHDRHPRLMKVERLVVQEIGILKSKECF